MAARDPLGHSLRLLRWMSEQNAQTFGVRELAGQLEMTPSLVSRLLGRLAEEQLVKQDQNGQYSLGLELVRLGMLVAQKQDLRAIARPHLARLAAQCHETVILGLYDPARRQMLNFDMIQSADPLTYVIVMNSWFEIYRGGSGLAILAFLPPWEQDLILEIAQAEANEQAPWLYRDSLAHDLATIRERGYAFTHGRRLHGAASVSAPIFAADGSVIGDVVVTVPDIRWTQHSEAELASGAMEAAKAITADLGGHAPEV